MVSGAILFDSPDGAFSIEGRFESATVAKGRITLKKGFYCPDRSDKYNIVLEPQEVEWSATPDGEERRKMLLARQEQEKKLEAQAALQEAQAALHKKQMEAAQRAEEREALLRQLYGGREQRAAEGHTEKRARRPNLEAPNRQP
jgi:hypothetical protein